MESLIKYGKTLIIIVCFLFSVSLFAQEEIIDAFKDSYALEKNGDYADAVKKLKSVYKADSYELNLRMGWLYYLNGQLTESSSFYNKAIALKPYAIEPKFGLAYPISAQEKWDKIITLYNDILEIDPQNTTANYRLGLIYYNRKNYEKASVYLEKVVNLYPFDYDSLILFAWNNFMLQKTREARVLFNKVLMYNPGDQSALDGLKLIK